MISTSCENVDRFVMMLSHVVNVVMISTSCERRFNAQEEMLALSGTQRHVGDHCAQISYKKRHVLWFAQAKLPDSLLRLHIPSDGVICIWPRAI